MEARMTPPWITVTQDIDPPHLVTVQHTVKNRYVEIDPTGMSEDETERAISAATVMLERSPVNREERRKAASRRT